MNLNSVRAWTNNQENLVMAKIVRLLVTTDWEQAFPLTRGKALDRVPSDHNPLLLDAGDNCSFGKNILDSRSGGWRERF